jgi:hypothetical protein
MPADEREMAQVEGVAEACGQLQGFLRWDPQLTHLAYHQVDDVVGEVLRLDLIQIPLPSPTSRIMPQQPLLVQRIQKLDKKERITLGALVDQTRERFAEVGWRMERVGHQLV